MCHLTLLLDVTPLSQGAERAMIPASKNMITSAAFPAAGVLTHQPEGLCTAYSLEHLEQWNTGNAVEVVGHNSCCDL